MPLQNKKIELTGISFPKQIMFASDDYSVSFNPHNLSETIELEKDNRKINLYRQVKNIPLIRGMALLLEMLLSFLIRNKFLSMGIIGIIIYISFSPENTFNSKSLFWDNYLKVLLYGGVLVYIFSAFKNHGAEHKVISAYDTNNDLTMENIKKQPKENRRCGTVLVVWLYAISLPLRYLVGGDYPLFYTLIIFGFAYEICLLARRKDFIGNLCYSIGWMGQKITTREPNDELLLKSRNALKALLDKENVNYKI